MPVGIGYVAAVEAELAMQQQGACWMTDFAMAGSSRLVLQPPVPAAWWLHQGQQTPVLLPETGGKALCQGCWPCAAVRDLIADLRQNLLKPFAWKQLGGSHKKP